MDELLETITEAETINPKFRVWITTEAHPHFPISVLQVEQILIPGNRDQIRCYLRLHLLLICLTSLTRAKCGTRSTLCWKVGNISRSTELFAL